MNYLINIKKSATVKTISKWLCSSLVIMACLLFQSCETEIPATDTTPPTFSLLINGDGFSRTFTQADDFGRIQLNLKTDFPYNFIYTGHDDGGLSHMELAIPHINFVIESPISSPWTRTTWGPFSRFTWTGNRSTPVNGSILTGTFRVNDASGPFGIKLILDDFGGPVGPSNNTTRQLNILSGQNTTEVINQ